MSLAFLFVFKKINSMPWQNSPVTWQPCLLIGNTWALGSLHSKVSDSNVCFWSVLWKSFRDPVFLKLQTSELPWFLSLLLLNKRVRRRGRREKDRWRERRRHHMEATCQHHEAWFPAHAISWSSLQVQPSFKEKGRNRSSSWWDVMCFEKGMWDWKCLAIFRKYALPLPYLPPS